MWLNGEVDDFDTCKVLCVASNLNSFEANRRNASQSLGHHHPLDEAHTICKTLPLKVEFPCMGEYIAGPCRRAKRFPEKAEVDASLRIVLQACPDTNHASSNKMRLLDRSGSAENGGPCSPYHVNVNPRITCLHPISGG
jgi:hypothetical protein